MKRTKLIKKLKQFAEEQAINSKGPLCVVLVITRRASKLKPPYSPGRFLTPKGGQVAGLSRSAVQAILEGYGITRVLAEEAGRTSRGSMNRMKAYLKLLNDFNNEGILDFSVIERWWIERTKAYFASMPFKLRPDPSKSLKRIVSELIDSAFVRQKECQGTMFAGAVMEHLVGAKLGISLPEVKIEHKGFSVADAPGKRKGDFLVGDTAIHVTTAPTEALIRKCRDNLSESLRPVIITTQDGVGGAAVLAKSADIEDRIDIVEIVQFIVTNIYEWSKFNYAERPTRIQDLVDAYNRIIDQTGTDPSLKITLI